jgi:hypothetical protein
LSTGLDSRNADRKAFKLAMGESVLNLERVGFTRDEF